VPRSIYRGNNGQIDDEMANLSAWSDTSYLVMIGSIVRCETSHFAIAASQLRLVPRRSAVTPDLQTEQRQSPSPRTVLVLFNTVKTFRNTPETEQRIAMLLPCRPDRILTETGPAGPRRIP
jgi:hypothetical protein